MERGGPLVGKHTILAVVAGSRAFGLATPASGTSRCGVYVAATEWFRRLEKPPAHWEGPLPEQFGREVERCRALALDGNPDLLEVLPSPPVEPRTPRGAEPREIRPAFLSRQVHRTFGRGEPTWDHVTAWTAEPATRLDSALPASPLPESPDQPRVESWRTSVRHRNLPTP
ncbi:nucleotidyltransferase [Streptomyces sp. WAC 06738]|uniref:DNA polymerase beta superfamily protein n=1 Tax=Streptomyces sp. WAC 06738 TaxID=2203210 RepID=UPI000F6D0CAE|nr:nucleotidyltransferase domain-containing protein [Streptomyces sp. WAC 06738]AZM45206.1 nucleotidyltransferase [Streptomyces sp. WAC 06738]